MTAEELKDRRLAIGFSRKRLSVEMCVSYDAVRHWENDERTMSPAMIRLFGFIERDYRKSGPPSREGGLKALYLKG